MLEAISKMNNREMTAEIFKIWLMVLSPYSFEEIRSAFNLFITSESRMPMPADIVRIIRGSGEDRALSALIKVENAVRRHGAYETVVFDDPGIHAAIAGLGGWIRLCGLTDTEMVWWRKDFRERYEHWSKIGHSENEYPIKLPGIHELGNMEAGYPPGPPVIVGDRDKCRQLFEGETRTDDRVTSLMQAAFRQGALKEIPR